MDQENNSYATGFTTSPTPISQDIAMVQESHKHQLSMQESQHKHEINIKNKDLGLIGCLFGNAENASKNIAALICLILIIGAIIFSCIIYNCGNNNDFIETIWQMVLPVVTLSLGYIFGKKD